jgi:hypothetical protein
LRPVVVLVALAALIGAAAFFGLSSPRTHHSVRVLMKKPEVVIEATDPDPTKDAQTATLIAGFETLENRGLGGTYAATYDVRWDRVTSTQTVWQSRLGLSYEDVYPGDQVSKNILNASTKLGVVLCTTSPSEAWQCNSDPAGNGWSLRQLEAQPWGVAMQVSDTLGGIQNQPGLGTHVIGTVRVRERTIAGLVAECLDADLINSQPFEVCLSPTGVLLSFEQSGEPAVAITSLSGTIPADAFVPPAPVQEIN